MTTQLASSDEEATRPPGAFQGALLPHQRDGLEWLLATPRALLADDVGLGKTIQVLALVGALKDAGDHSVHRPILWLTDPTLVDQTRREVERFLPGLGVLASTDPDYGKTKKADKSRAARFPGGMPDILVANYHQTNAKDSLLKWDVFRSPGLVVLDEAMSLKGGNKLHQSVATFTVSAERAVAMTATPVENHAYETYLILELLRPSGLWPRPVFEDEFVQWDHYPGQAPKPVDLFPHRREEFRRFLESVMLRRTTEDVGQSLPVRVGERYRKVPLTRAQHREYTHARRRRGLNLSKYREQVALVHNGHSGLLDACMEALEERAGEKVVVYCERREVLDLLTGRLDDSGIGWRLIHGDVEAGEERELVLKQFRDDPNVRVLVGSRVIERGLNLQHARVLISLVQSYNPAREHQREGRIRRIGSPHETYEHLVLEPDVPQAERRGQILTEKTQRSSDLLD